MKQLIARIDEGLHARLKRRAASEGRSVNALVTEALEGAAPATETSQQWMSRRARERGVRIIEPTGPPADPGELQRTRESTRGLGPCIDGYIEWARGPRPGA